MFEVTKNNFSELFPQIEWAIKNADFVSIDTEFTGLCLNADCKPSLFDTSAERYLKLKKSVETFTVSQIGITVFVSDTKENRYNATSFNFYLCPSAFGSLDPKFTLQSTAIQFLTKHNFDFNKFLREGVPHLNCPQENEIMKALKEGIQHIGDNSCITEREIQCVCSRVASWLCQSKPGEFLTLPLKRSDPLISFIIQNEIRQRFTGTWTVLNGFGQIVIENIGEEKRLACDWHHTQHQLVINELLGFTRVFRLLQEVKKPLVGHNMLMDLLFIFSKFHQPLPDHYEQFKKEIHALFPVVFDTKHLHHYIKEKFKLLNLRRANNLEALDKILRSQTTVRITRMQPSIGESGGDDSAANKPHHAGYDSYLCGRVFIRICHLEHFRENSEIESMTTPFTFQSYFSTIESHNNCINLIRAANSHTKLDGADPACNRPPLLHVSYSGPGGRITSRELATILSFHGAVDIKMLSSTRAIVATSHFKEARDVLYSFQNDNTIHVTRYRYFLHSLLGRFLWWSTLSAASGSCVLLLYKVFKS